MEAVVARADEVRLLDREGAHWVSDGRYSDRAKSCMRLASGMGTGRALESGTPEAAAVWRMRSPRGTLHLGPSAHCGRA